MSWLYDWGPFKLYETFFDIFLTFPTQCDILVFWNHCFVRFLCTRKMETNQLKSVKSIFLQLNLAVKQDFTSKSIKNSASNSQKSSCDTFSTPPPPHKVSHIIWTAFIPKNLQQYLCIIVYIIIIQRIWLDSIA
jgi:hypothetical protein